MKNVDYASLKQAASHYQGERSYCSVIALAVAAGLKFGKARAIFARHGRKNGRGTYRNQQRAAAAEAGLTLTAYDSAVKVNGTHLRKVTERLPKQGTFWVYTRGHVSCVRDGVLHDWAEPNGSYKGSSKRIQFILRVEK